MKLKITIKNILTEVLRFYIYYTNYFNLILNF